MCPLPKAAMAIVLSGGMISCAFEPHISNRITPDEYEIYSAWLQQHFVKQPPKNLFILSRTLIFDPEAATNSGCANALRQAGVSGRLIAQLHALGDAEFLMRVYPTLDKNLHIPWPYEEIDTLPWPEPGPYRAISFSRVAFNRQHNEALLSVSDLCGGLCGHGGALIAHKEHGQWNFRSIGCVWVS